MEKRGLLQYGAGLGAVTEIRLTMPADAPPSHALTTIAQSIAPLVRIDGPGGYGLHLRIASLVNHPDLQISLPLPSSSGVLSASVTAR